MDSALAVIGSSEIVFFVLGKSFVRHQVSFLPTNYNRDLIFELPLALGVISKGLVLKDMERGNNDYSWSC